MSGVESWLKKLVAIFEILIVRSWPAVPQPCRLISANSSVVGPTSKSAFQRACFAQFRNVSGDPIPRSRANSAIGRIYLVSSEIAPRGDSSDFFNKGASTPVSFAGSQKATD